MGSSFPTITVVNRNNIITFTVLSQGFSNTRVNTQLKMTKTFKENNTIKQKELNNRRNNT